MLRKKLFLIPLVMSSEAVYAITPDAVRTALSNYCVPYSDTNEKGRVLNTPVCASVFEGKYNPSKSGVKCDCYEGSVPTAKFLKYDSNINQRKCRPQCDQGFGAKKTTNGDCPSGYFKSRIDRPDSGSGSFTFNCEICKAGEYSNNGFECIACAPGYYSDKDGLSKCPICPAGTYSETAGGATKCLPCNPGQFCPEGSSKPSMCPNGQYSPDTKTCDYCPAGYKCPGGTLIKCPAGTYQGVTGQTSCSDCTTGHYCPEGATSPTICPVGYYAGEKQGSCSKCDNETWTQTNYATCGTLTYTVTGYCQKEGSTSATANYSTRPDSKWVVCKSCGWVYQWTRDSGSSNETLIPGTYKVDIAGGEGGRSGSSGIKGKWCPGPDGTGSKANLTVPDWGYSGGKGGYNEYTFTVNSTTNATYSVGGKGSKGSNASGWGKTGSNGGNGGDSTFTVNGTTYRAYGGEGGQSSSGGLDRSSCNGRPGQSYGSNTGNGYIRLYRYDPNRC